MTRNLSNQIGSLNIALTLLPYHAKQSHDKKYYSMNDFTVSRYLALLLSLKSRGREFQPLNEYIQSPNHSFSHSLLILRHDVDLLPHNALAIAQLEHDLGIRGTYYFRIVPESFDVGVIEKIAELGHEVGYHYEDVDLVVKRQTANGKRQVSELIGDRLKVIGDRSQVIGVPPKRRRTSRWQAREAGESGRNKAVSGSMFQVSGSKYRILNQSLQANLPGTWNVEPETDLIDLAMESFLKNLETMRKIADIKTICMHGSPLSKYDNRLLWTKYDYRDYGIIGEPYFDVDFSEVAYYTDTGRRWDGEAVSVRDKVTPVQRSLGVVGGDRSQVIDDRLQVKGDRSRRSINKPETTPSHLSPNTYHLFPKYRTTHEMIRAIEEGHFPQMAMLTVHPQRWHDRAVPWVRELVWQRFKNVVKRVVVAVR